MTKVSYHVVGDGREKLVQLVWEDQVPVNGVETPEGDGYKDTDREPYGGEDKILEDAYGPSSVPLGIPHYLQDVVNAKEGKQDRLMVQQVCLSLSVKSLYISFVQ